LCLQEMLMVDVSTVRGSSQTLWFLLAHDEKIIGSISPLASFVVRNVCTVWGGTLQFRVALGHRMEVKINY
jgi:hypothetical protein